jgi:hypothetical protein
VQSRLLLDVVVAQGTAVLELLAGEDETLLVWWDALLVYPKISAITYATKNIRHLHTLDLGLDIVNGVRRLHLKGDRLAREGLHEAAGLNISLWLTR